MTISPKNHSQDNETQEPGRAPKEKRRSLTPEARRALDEADARRKAHADKKAEAQKEVGGRDGPDPVRHGDWEKDGIASDF